MRISIIVPAFNEERLLANSLREIQNAAAVFSNEGWDWELIVCDNNSTDRTTEIARSLGAQVVFEPVNQIARARNCGAAAASGDWLLFVDADSHPTPELFTDVAEQIKSGSVLAGGVTISMDNIPWMARRVASLWNTLSRCRKLMAGSFIFVEAEAFRQIGGFSKELFAAEELDLSKRLKKLARQSHRRIVILHRHPLKTSARKIDLYTPWELLRLVGGVVLSGGKALRSRETTHMWYDGRR